MNLLTEIRECFASKENGAIKIKALKVPYDCWYLRTEEGYGVAVQCSNEVEISEYFASCKIQTREMSIDSKDMYLLILSCFNDSFAHEFASICAEFADPGINGMTRAALISDPVSWWRRWKELIGNSSSDKKVYDVLGELLAYEYLIKTGKDIEWTGPDAGTHDIDGTDVSFEVKSTIKKYGTDITISSQFQMESEKPLYLMFCRFEKSRLGECVNEVISRLISVGCDEITLEKKLTKLGLEKGRSVRNEKYKVLEKKIYVVDDEFPRIIPSSFKEGKLPERVLHIKYTVNLEGIKYENW